FDFVTSFVLDQRVDAIIESRGFDVNCLMEEEREAVILHAWTANRAQCLDQGREAAFMALPLATLLIERETGGHHLARRPDNHLEEALESLRRNVPRQYELAENLAATVLKHGHRSNEAVNNAIEECLCF